MGEEEMFDRTPEERLLQVRQALVADLERHEKAIASAQAKLKKTQELLALFDEGCKGLGMRAEAFSITDGFEVQFRTDEETDIDEDE